MKPDAENARMVAEIIETALSSRPLHTPLITVATEPHPRGLRLAASSDADASGFTLYPATPLTAEEARAETERIDAVLTAIVTRELDAIGKAQAEQQAKTDPLADGEARLDLVVEMVITAMTAIRSELGPLTDEETETANLLTSRLVRLFNLAAVRAAKPTPRKGRRLRGPKALSTYEELFHVSAAVADARVGKNWAKSPAGNSLIHHRKRSAFDVRFVPAVAGDRWASPTPEIAEGEGNLFALAAANGGLDTAYLAYVCADLAVEHEHETVSLDDLGRMIGRRPRSTKEREAMRRDLWGRLKFLDGLTVWGTRKGTYRDPKTHETVAITSRDALFLISGTDWPEQGSLNGDDVPTGVKFGAGPLLSEWRGVPEVLTSFGDFRRLVAIPRGQASGNWARAMGTTITQRWRERATHGGTTKFTRRYLLENVLPEAPTASDVLSGANPLRARTYFTAALKTLRTEHVIGPFTEPDATKLPRYDWADVWLGQSVVIQPRADVLTASETIRAHADALPAPKHRRGRPKKAQ